VELLEDTDIDKVKWLPSAQQNTKNEMKQIRRRHVAIRRMKKKEVGEKQDAK